MSMKFDDMKLGKNDDTAEEATGGHLDDVLEEMKIADFAIGNVIGRHYLRLSPIGRMPLLCALVETTAKGRGMTSFEILDEIRQTIEEVRGK